MLSIAIDRVRARYRMPAAALREQPRVQRIVEDALTRVLEGAIEREGLGGSGHVCIRDVHAVATVQLRQPDSALATGVGAAIAAAIRKSLDGGSSSAVQYGFRVHALIDLASSATAGDFSRSWAWTQLGIWRSDFPLRADVTADLVVRALAKEPLHAVAVAVYLAREKADRLRDLITRATPGAWNALAQAARLAAGVNQVSVPGAATDTRKVIGSDEGAGFSRSVALRVAAHSAIARVSTDRFAVAPGEIRRALTTLALLEVEPSLLRGGDVSQLLTAVEQAIDAVAPHATAPCRESPEGQPETADPRNQAEAPETRAFDERVRSHAVRDDRPAVVEDLGTG